MRRCSSSAALILALAATPGADCVAQVLDLDAAAGPPELGLDTYAADCVRQLDHEMVTLAEQADGAEQAGDVRRAAQGVRWLAVALLDRADRGAEGGTLDFIAGLRLFRGRVALDEVLNRALEPDGDHAAATSSLRRFNDRLEVLSRKLATEAGADIDEELGALLRPLADAVAVLAPGAVVNHWVPAGDIASGPGIAEPVEIRIDGLLQQLETQLNAVELTGQTEDELRRITEFLRRGAAFAEYRPAVERYCRLLTEVLDLADAAWGAGWLDEERRDRYRQQIHDAITLLGDPATRADAEPRLDRLAAARHAIERISILAQGPADPSAGPKAKRTRVAGVDLEALRTAFLAAAATANDRDRGMETLVRVLDAMIAYRRMGEPQLAHELRRVWRKLDGSYQAAERATIKQLPVLVGRPDALSNPALASLLSDQEQYVEDLGRLARVPDWVDTIRFISPRAAGPFTGHVRRIAGWLTDPARRPDAVRTLGVIEQQLADFYPMPFEQELQRGGRPAIVATGGLHDQLATRIEEDRRRWAEAWGTAPDSAATERMRLLHRLTRIMADTETLLGLGDDVLVLNRWAAWEMDPDTFQRLVADLGNRLKLATTAAVEGDDAALTEQLNRIQATPAALVSRLADALDDPLRRLPSRALSIVGQAVRRPPPEAWMLHRRREIGDICRFEMELQFARSTGRDELADRLTAYVDMLAGDLLGEIGP
ncbi:MAG: hypothetical protein ACYSU7_18110 [Planctomycetota bacterium]